MCFVIWVTVSDRFDSCFNSFFRAFSEECGKSAAVSTRSMLLFQVGIVSERLESSASGSYFGIIFIPAWLAGGFFFAASLWWSLYHCRSWRISDMDSLLWSVSCFSVKRGFMLFNSSGVRAESFITFSIEILAFPVKMLMAISFSFSFRVSMASAYCLEV